MPIETALRGVLPPILIAVVVLLAAWRPWSKQRAGARPAWGSALALSLAYAATDWLVSRRWPGFPPSESLRWLPYLGIGAALASLAAPKRGGWVGAGTRLVVALAIAAACMIVLRSGVLFRGGNWERGAVWAAAGAVAATLIAGAVAAGGGLSGSGRVGLTLLVASTGAAVTLLQHLSAVYSQMAGAIAAVMGVAMVLAWWRPAPEPGLGGGVVFAVLYVGLLVARPVEIGSGLALVGAACAAGLPALPVISGWRAWQKTLLCVVVAAGLSVVAVWFSPSGFDFSGY